MLDATHTSALLGAPRYLSTNPIDTLIGKVGDVTVAALTPPSFVGSSIKPFQDHALQSLRDYVTDNIDGDAADTLMARIAATEALIAMGNKESNGVDPVYSLLSGNREFDDMPAGSLINLLF